MGEEVKQKIPLYTEPVKKNFTQEKLQEALTNLLALEKKTRLASDMPSTKELAHAILQLLRDCNQWKLLNTHISMLCKRRAQLKKVMQQVIQDGVKFVEETWDQETKIELIETIRTVSSGKLFVELERARLTRTLAEIREKEGDPEKACKILQDVAVETIGSMEAMEKSRFILNQMRLCLLTKNYVRAEIMSKKISTKTIDGEDYQAEKLKFYGQMIELYRNQGKYLEIAKAYFKCFQTKSIQEKEENWKSQLKYSIMYLLLSPFDSEVSDFLLRLKTEKKTSKLPSCKYLLEEMTKDELTPWPFKYTDEWKTEEFLSEMVSNGQLFAKIDRPAGIIVFSKKKSSNDTLNDWGADVRSLLSLVEKTCHIINKENMIHKIK